MFPARNKEQRAVIFHRTISDDYLGLRRGHSTTVQHTTFGYFCNSALSSEQDPVKNQAFLCGILSGHICVGVDTSSCAGRAYEPHWLHDIWPGSLEGRSDYQAGQPPTPWLMRHGAGAVPLQAFQAEIQRKEDFS